MKKHLSAKIGGDVQGVFFRISAARRAEELHITGMAKNEEGGMVTIEAEGEEDNLKKFLAWCKEGPLLAKVGKIESSVSDDLNGYDNFMIQ